MRFLQTHNFAVSLCFLPTLVNATAIDISIFVRLLDALGNLGYDGKGATAFGALYHLTVVNAPGQIPIITTYKLAYTYGGGEEVHCQSCTRKVFTVKDQSVSFLTAYPGLFDQLYAILV